jgi:hypothetical protein
MKGLIKMAKLKFKKEKGSFIISFDGKELIFPTLHDALEYIFYRRFMALVAGERIGCHVPTLNPVYSLLPPVVEKMAKFYDLGVELI